MGAAPLRMDGVAVAIDGKGVLLRGPSGSGRSDLALRLIDEGAKLVNDEQVELHRHGDRLTVAAPALMPTTLKGYIEARGLGLVPVPHVEGETELVWVVDMAASGSIERLPPAQSVDLLGVSVPLMRIDPAAPSATAKLRLAVRCGAGHILGRE